MSDSVSTRWFQWVIVPLVFLCVLYLAKPADGGPSRLRPVMSQPLRPPAQGLLMLPDTEPDVRPELSEPESSESEPSESEPAPSVTADSAGIQIIPEAQADDGYRFGPGDSLDIEVWKNQDLSLRAMVLPDGTINFPLIGEIRVKGITVPRLKAFLSEQLRPYLRAPEVTLTVRQAESMAVYVIGKVRRPGRFRFIGQIDVLQALSLAGGLTAFAREKDIRILRQDEDQTRIIHFNYKSTVNGDTPEQNIDLLRGDTIVVR